MIPIVRSLWSLLSVGLFQKRNPQGQAGGGLPVGEKSLGEMWRPYKGAELAENTDELNKRRIDGEEIVSEDTLRRVFFGQ